MPLPWRRTGTSLGFGDDGAWLPQPAHWAGRSVEAQAGDASSMLELYRAALALRRSHPALGDGTLSWRDLGADAVAFARDPGFACVVNLGPDHVVLDAGVDVLLASGPLDVDGLGGVSVPIDTAVWLSV